MYDRDWDNYFLDVSNGPFNFISMGHFPILMGHLTISMRQKVENEIWHLNAYLYDVAPTMEFYYLRTAW